LCSFSDTNLVLIVKQTGTHLKTSICTQSGFTFTSFSCTAQYCEASRVKSLMFDRIFWLSMACLRPPLLIMPPLLSPPRPCPFFNVALSFIWSSLAIPTSLATRLLLRRSKFNMRVWLPC
jgi:hypothetical protein